MSNTSWCKLYHWVMSTNLILPFIVQILLSTISATLIIDLGVRTGWKNSIGTWVPALIGRDIKRHNLPLSEQVDKTLFWPGSLR